MEILKEKYTITELSEMLQITDHALRYYEKEFGLNIPKDERGRRYYTAEMANAMYKIKVMRNEGLEIKAIKRVLQEEPVLDSPPSVSDETAITVSRNTDNIKELQLFFQEFGQQLTQNLSIEISSTREQLSKEINKSKLELGACVENSYRKLENKMEKHYQDVDRALGLWRERNRRNPFRRFLHRLHK